MIAVQGTQLTGWGLPVFGGFIGGADVSIADGG